MMSQYPRSQTAGPSAIFADFRSFPVTTHETYLAPMLLNGVQMELYADPEDIFGTSYYLFAGFKCSALRRRTSDSVAV
jgi:hypothetical protein